MRVILFVLLLPVFGYSQTGIWDIYYLGSKPEYTLKRVELKKDTMFVYRHVRVSPHNMSINREWGEWNDREVYVVKGKEIVLIAVERARIRKIKVDAEEEYW